jgi:hypothetical protein
LRYPAGVHCANREYREEHGDFRQIVAHHQAYGVGGLEACEEEGKGGGRRWPESRGRNNPSTMRLLPIPSNYRRSDSTRCRTLDDRSVVLQQRRGADHANCQEGNNQERPYRPSILLTYMPKKFQWGLRSRVWKSQLYLRQELSCAPRDFLRIRRLNDMV